MLPHYTNHCTTNVSFRHASIIMLTLLVKAASAIGGLTGTHLAHTLVLLALLLADDAIQLRLAASTNKGQSWRQSTKQ